MKKYDIGVKVRKMKLKELLDLIAFDTKIMITNYCDAMSFKHEKIFHGRYRESEEFKHFYDYKVLCITSDELRGIIIIDIKE